MKLRKIVISNETMSKRNPLIPYGDEPLNWWFALPGYAGYEVSVSGQIRKRYKKGYRILRDYPKKWCKGSVRVIKLEGKEVNVARLIYETFYGSIPKDKMVIHKNGIVSDHAPNNLVLASRKDIGVRYGQRAKQKAVCQYDPDTMECLNIYRSARECGRQTYMSNHTIIDRCNGNVKRSPAADGLEYCWDDDECSYRWMKQRIQRYGLK